jgi:hypothetical protein
MTMQAIDIIALETVTGGTQASYRRLGTTIHSGVQQGAIVGLDLVPGGGVLKAGSTFTIEKGQTIKLSNLPKFGRAH